MIFRCPVNISSTLVRFHPSKRFHLSIASYKGAVTVYDVQGLRKIFHASEAHSAPCRDISMCTSQPALLVSVGYDCKINIFDIRRNRAQASTDRLTYSHPLSTVALSECGTYLCAGNLKGELIAYDMRSTKAPLAVRSVHDAAVTRVAFVPVPSGDNQQNGSLNSSENATGLATEAPRVERAPSDELRKSIAANLLSTQNQLTSLGYGVSTPTIVRRDSFASSWMPKVQELWIACRPAWAPLTEIVLTGRRSTEKPQPYETANRQSLCPPVASGPSSVDNSVNSSTTESLQRKLL